MNNKLYSGKTKRISKFYLVKERILPFEEGPSGQNINGKNETGKEDDENAHKLFSIFTADIINKEIVFTR